MKVVGIIPCRSGSKRIPGKNTKWFVNKPLIQWTINAAINSKIFDKIYISTDNKDLKHKVRLSKNCEILMREDGYSDDQTTVQEATIKTLEQIETQKKEKYDIVVQLLPTTPLRDKYDIRTAFDCFKEKRLDFLVSSSPYLQVPQWAFTDDDKPLIPIALKTRSQDLQICTCPNMAIAIAIIKKLKEQKTFYGKGVHLYPISYKKGIDIDTMDDWDFALMIQRNEKDKKTFKEIEKILNNYKILKLKIKEDRKDIKDIQNEEIKNQIHKVMPPEKWTIEIDDKIRRKQKINAKIRSYKRTVELLKKMEAALKLIKDEKYYNLIELYYFKNIPIEKIRNLTGFRSRKINIEKNKLLEKLHILFTGGI